MRIETKKEGTACHGWDASRMSVGFVRMGVVVGAAVAEVAQGNDREIRNLCVGSALRQRPQERMSCSLHGNVHFRGPEMNWNAFWERESHQR